MQTMPRIPSEKDPFADRRRWTADDCRKLEALGILEPDGYELLDGAVVERAGRGVAHGISHGRTLPNLCRVFRMDYVLPSVSIAVDDWNQPEPDVCVTRFPAREYIHRGNPTHADMRLIVEVSDTTLWRDKNTKARLYGRAGVPDYWVLDVNNRVLFAYRQPMAEGYADVQEYNETQSIAPLAAPNNPIRIADLLP
jgi:Uma2 family endonuclease